jgi:hypothetical protein
MLLENKTIVNVYWPAYGRFYTGVVDAQCDRKGQHVTYYDGDRKWHKFGLMVQGRDYHVMGMQDNDSPTNVTIDVNDLTCAICTEIFESPTSVTICGHTFCNRCITHAINCMDVKNKRCPLCNTSMTSMRDTYSNHFAANIVKKVVEQRQRQQDEVPTTPTKTPAKTIAKSRPKTQFTCKKCGGLKPYRAKRCDGYCVQL